MATFCDIRDGTITNVVHCDEAFAAKHNLTDLSNVTPAPGLGWTTADEGKTWTAPPVPASVTNTQTLHERAQAALALNAEYLAIASPTSAQAITQVGRLTRECSALIRLLLGLLDSTEGT